MSEDKDLWNIFTEKTRNILNEEYTPINFQIMTEYVTALDSFMRKYAYEENWNKEKEEYEAIHIEYGKYRWKYNL
jgi:hypothetical protein